MKAINRSAVVVRPAQPFLDWLHQADPSSANVTLEDLRKEATVYLIPECDTDERVLERLSAASGRIFEEQLNAWYRHPSAWPKKRGLQEFRKWFDWSFHSVIFDAGNGLILREEMEPD